MSEPSHETVIPDEMHRHIDSFLSPDSKRRRAGTNHEGKRVYGGIRVVRTPEQLAAVLADPEVRLINLRPDIGVSLDVHASSISGAAFVTDAKGADYHAGGVVNFHLSAPLEVNHHAVVNAHQGFITVTSGRVDAYGTTSVDARDGFIYAYGNTQVTATGDAYVEAHEQARVASSDNSHVKSLGNSMITACGTAKVYAWDLSSVILSGHSRCFAYETANVVAGDESRVEAQGDGRIEAFGRAVVNASSMSQVTATGQAVVHAQGESQVTAFESVEVSAIGNAVVTVSDHCHVHAQGDARISAWGSARIKAEGSAQVEVHSPDVRVLVAEGSQVTVNGAEPNAVLHAQFLSDDYQF
ncbi:hypothetical protein [Streptomyces chartreusis]|uniref:hypothetical protein n=1 Tax=Streptomyces chartreusis TaxID=1969 RepID=UPI0033EFB9D7